MKKSILNLIIILFVFCSTKSEVNNSKSLTIKQAISYTTLDSLQGKWVNENDTTNSIEFKGRDVFQTNLNQDSIFVVTQNKLYFTNIPFRFDDSIRLPIDTSLKSGSFFVFYSEENKTSECYEFNGFYKNSVSHTFSMNTYGYFKMSSILIFRKQN